MDEQGGISAVEWLDSSQSDTGTQNAQHSGSSASSTSPEINPKAGAGSEELGVPDAFGSSTVSSQQFIIDNIDKSPQHVQLQQVDRFVTKTASGAQDTIHTQVRNLGTFTVDPRGETVASVQLRAPNAAWGWGVPNVTLQTSVRFTNVSASSVIGVFIRRFGGQGI